MSDDPDLFETDEELDEQFELELLKDDRLSDEDKQHIIDSEVD